MIDVVIVSESDYEVLSRLGSHPELQRELERATGVRRRVSVVHPLDADSAEGRISVLAPVGTALLGLSVGQAIEWQFPDGSRRRLRVEDVT